MSLYSISLYYVMLLKGKYVLIIFVYHNLTLYFPQLESVSTWNVNMSL